MNSSKNAIWMFKWNKRSTRISGHSTATLSRWWTLTFLYPIFFLLVTTFLFAQLFNVVFIIMHSQNYPNNPNVGLYMFLVFGINLPWTLVCIRNFIVVPNTPVKRTFCIIYDSILTKVSSGLSIQETVCLIHFFFLAILSESSGAHDLQHSWFSATSVSRDQFNYHGIEH
jgi:hypothetical protein